MSYQVIARKYRPQRFSEVVGQEHVTQTLANAIRSGRIAHAYLFVGPRGTGKTTLARIFAKCLNCTGGPKEDFPDDDQKANEITEGRSMDVMEIDGASNRGVEQIRELRETVKYSPATSKFKIYIIDEVHMLTKEAFNALLKTLEEPPAHVKFMFATTEPEKVLPTILSRCQRFDLRRIPSLLIVKHLASIAVKEGVVADEAALHAIARGAEGGMRDAESTLDQLISFCGSKIEEADVLSMFGLTSRGQVLALATAVLSGESGRVLRELNDLAKNGKDLSRLLADLLNHFRNLLVYQVTKGDASVLEASEAELAAMKEQSALVSTDGLTRIMEVLSDCESRLSHAASKKIALEVGLIRAAQARNAVSLGNVLQKLQQLRTQSPPASPTANVQAVAAPISAPIPVPAPTAPAPRPAPPVAATAPTPAAPIAPPPAAAPAPVVTPSVPAAPIDLHAVWLHVIQAAAGSRMLTRAVFFDTHPVSHDRRTFTVGLAPEAKEQLGLFENAKTIAFIQEKLAEKGVTEVNIKVVVGTAPEDWRRPANVEAAATAAPAIPAAARPLNGATPAGKPAAPPPPPPPVSMEEFKNDPLIQKALELFKGQIAQVGGTNT